MVLSNISLVGSDPVDIFTYANPEDNKISAEIQEKGKYEPGAASIICKLFDSFHGGFLDVGANIGAYTIPIVPCMRGRKAFAVEGNAVNVEHLLASVLENQFDNVIVISNSVGSFSDVSLGQTTIDDIAEVERSLNTVLVMRLDLGGDELNALKGASKLMATHPPCFVQMSLDPKKLQAFHTRPDQIIDMLEGYDYDTRPIDGDVKKKYILPQQDLDQCLTRLRKVTR